MPGNWQGFGFGRYSRRGQFKGYLLGANLVRAIKEARKCEAVRVVAASREPQLCGDVDVRRWRSQAVHGWRG